MSRSASAADKPPLSRLSSASIKLPPGHLAKVFVAASRPATELPCFAPWPRSDIRLLDRHASHRTASTTHDIYRHAPFTEVRPRRKTLRVVSHAHAARKPWSADCLISPHLALDAIGFLSSVPSSGCGSHNHNPSRRPSLFPATWGFFDGEYSWIDCWTTTWAAFRHLIRQSRAAASLPCYAIRVPSLYLSQPGQTSF